MPHFLRSLLPCVVTACALGCGGLEDEGGVTSTSSIRTATSSVFSSSVSRHKDWYFDGGQWVGEDFNSLEELGLQHLAFMDASRKCQTAGFEHCYLQSSVVTKCNYWHGQGKNCDADALVAAGP